MKRLVNFFNKPSMSFDKIILLGACEFLLILLKESYGRLYGLVSDVYHALFVTVLLALTIQLIRLINEVIRDK